MQFFILKDEPISDGECATTDYVGSDDAKHGDAPRCPTCGHYVAMREWLPPFRVELTTWGTEYADVVNFMTDLLVSLHFKQAWEQSGLTGLAGFEPVEIVELKRRRKSIGNPPPYFRAVVHRSQTAIDLEASEFTWDAPPNCATCRLGENLKSWKRVVIDESTWTGEDAFVARGLPGTIIVSDRFKEFCEREHIKNVRFLPAETYEYDFWRPREEAV